ncbi:hypothetical protein AAOGI_07640 [Agarivorans albus]
MRYPYIFIVSANLIKRNKYFGCVNNDLKKAPLRGSGAFTYGLGARAKNLLRH